MLKRMKGSSRLLAVTVAATLLAACGTSRTVVVQPASGSHSATRTWGRAAAVSSPSRRSYRVARGDTLYSIAFRNGLDFRELARWNGIPSPYTIWPGQVLRLTASRGGARRYREVARAHESAAAPVVQPVPKPAPPSTPVAVVTTTSHAPVAQHAAASEVHSAPAPAPTGTRSLGGVAWRWPASGALVKGFQAGDAIPGIEIGGHAGDPVRAAADGVVVYSGNGLVGYGELIIIKHNDSYLSAYGHNRKRLVKEGERVSVGQEIAEMGDTGASRDELQFQIRKNGNPVNPMDYLPSR